MDEQLILEPYLQASGQINNPDNSKKILNHFVVLYDLFKNNQELNLT